MMDVNLLRVTRSGTAVAGTVASGRVKGVIAALREERVQMRFPFPAAQGSVAAFRWFLFFGSVERFS
jgi:hypothetical protein